MKIFPEIIIGLDFPLDGSILKVMQHKLHKVCVFPQTKTHDSRYFRKPRHPFPQLIEIIHFITFKELLVPQHS
ncbi:hypothetical protein SDC9_78889 [bioreactor metagenome]|uniref:Uncharacterized protein n=1 Tax=bioreactor metagenome TaxID=1076179 RepID=A0A644YVF3_9ZZZZ